MQFGTLSDYFQAVRESGGTHHGPLTHGFPTLAGDFFPYADMDTSYWTGYFTSRPYYKRLDRILEYHLRYITIFMYILQGCLKSRRMYLYSDLMYLYLFCNLMYLYLCIVFRSSEILFTSAMLHSRRYDITSTIPLSRCTQLLITSRRALGLFQHHDGITGTAREHVVQDYGER